MRETDHRKVVEEYVQFAAQEASPKAIQIQKVERESAADLELYELRHCITNHDCSYNPIQSCYY